MVNSVPARSSPKDRSGQREDAGDDGGNEGRLGIQLTETGLWRCGLRKERRKALDRVAAWTLCEDGFYGREPEFRVAGLLRLAPTGRCRAWRQGGQTAQTVKVLVVGERHFGVFHKDGGKLHTGSRHLKEPVSDAVSRGSRRPLPFLNQSGPTRIRAVWVCWRVALLAPSLPPLVNLP